MTDAEETVIVRGLTVAFGDFKAVDDISFSVRRGEIFGFLGANGAGKTTTIRVLCGLLEPTAGDVRVAGVDPREGELEVKSKVGYMSQKFTLYNDLTVDENLAFTAALRKLDPAIFRRRREELLGFVSFERPIDSRVQDLPGGIKQQVSLAAALLHDPEVVFLDEPTAGVSPAARARFWALIRKLAGTGKTVFVTTHYMDEAEQCDRIALMREGRIIALDTPEALKARTFPKPMFEFDPKRALTYEQLAAVGREPVFTFFEPYGLRFHAAVASEEEWERARPRLEELFHVRRVKPSLEDVFIGIVEGGR